MSPPRRVTQPMLDVLELLVRATREGREVHGYEAMHETQRSGPTVYNVLDKLEDMGWIIARFEDTNADNPKRPPRRFYRLTGEAVPQAQALLRQRRSAIQERTRKLGWAQLVVSACKMALGVR